MTKLMVNDDGVRDPYTKSVERFLELFETGFPESEEKRRLVKRLEEIATEAPLYRDTEAVELWLANALALSLTVTVPLRDRVMLSTLYQDCLRYSSTMGAEALAAQAVLEKAYAEASSDERALLASLAGARDDLFESPNSKHVAKSFDNAAMLLITQRRDLKRPTSGLFKVFMQNGSNFAHPSLAG
jgi:hypothetical protein